MFGVFLVGGLVVCFLGRTLFKAVLFITGVLMANFLVMLIFYSAFHKAGQANWVGWVVLGVSVLLGLCLGYFFLKIVRLGAFCLAAWGGFALGILLYNSFLYKLDSDGAFWGITIGLALFMGILALCFFDHILILATALLGSFMAVYGIGLVAGRYTNPFTIVELIKMGQIESIDPVFYAYLAGNILLCVLGCIHQYRQKNGNPDHNPYHGMERYKFR